MTSVSDLDFDATVVTFDDPAHPGGLVLAATHALTGAPAYAGYVRYPDGGFAWLSATAVWGMDGHPWALVHRHAVHADEPARPGGPAAACSGGEMRITDDLEAGLHTLDPRRRPRRPRRLATTGVPSASPAAADWQLLVEDGIDDDAPSAITVLDAQGALPSGMRLRAAPGLASRLLAASEEVRSEVALEARDLPRRLRSRVPDALVLRPPADGH